MKRCPYCAEEIQEAAIVCRYCGRDLRTPVPSIVPAPTPAEAKGSGGTRLDWRSGGAFVVALFASLLIFNVIMVWFLHQPIGLFDSFTEAIMAFYNVVLIALGVGFAFGGFIAGNLASPARSRWIGFVVGLSYAGWLIGKHLGDQQTTIQEMLMFGLVIVAACSVGGLIGSAARGAVWLLVVLIGGGVLLGLVLSDGTLIGTPSTGLSSPSEQALPNAPAPTTTPFKNQFGTTIVEPCVGIMSREMRFVSDGYQATGTLKNLCDLPIDQIRLRLQIYDDSNHVINTVYGTADSDLIPPDQFSTFTVKVNMVKQSRLVGYKLVVDQAEWAK